MRIIPVILIASITLLSFQTYGQVDTTNTRKRKSPRKEDGFDLSDKLFFGGNLGMFFGNETVVNLSPMIGVQLTEKLAVGTGPIYFYYKNDTYNYSTHMYGARLFGRYFLLENIFLHGEYEGINREVGDYGIAARRKNVVSIYVGGGIRQSLGLKSYLTLMGLWNLNESRYSPQRNPIIRGGITFGI